jgi:hypothetical protein
MFDCGVLYSRYKCLIIMNPLRSCETPLIKFVQIDYVLKIATRENFMLALNIDEYHYTHVLEHIKPMEKLVLSGMHQPVQPKSLR